MKFWDGQQGIIFDNNIAHIKYLLTNNFQNLKIA